MPTQGQNHVFISYSERDQWAADTLARQLHTAFKIKPWLRAWSVVPGRLTQEEQEKGLEQSYACVVLIGAAGVRDWQRLEVQASIAKRIEVEGSSFPVIPVFLPGCPAEVRATLSPFLQLYEPVQFASLDDQDALHRLVCGIQGEPPGEEKPAAIPCPYPGLEPFREGMAQYFFGREDEIADLHKKLDANPFVLVMGPSGSGKSSLVLAGLIPRLRKSETAPSPYLIHTLIPGREPLQSLAMIFVPEPGDPRRKQLASDMAQDERELSRAVQAELRQQPAHFCQVLLVVDQFEEVFTQCDNPAQGDAFIRNLLYACGEADGAVKMVLTLRSDFFTPCYDYDPLVDPRRLVTVKRLNGERLRWAIESSARAAGLLLQRGLVYTLLDDVGDEPGILPLVQYALRELFDRRSGRWLTMDAYHALGNEVDPELGGVKGVIAARAEAALAKLRANPKLLPEQVEPVVRRIFLRLVQVGENSPPTRQQVAWHEFFWASDAPEQRALLEEGLRLLIQERLLISDKDENDIVEVNLTHEVIIKVWKRLDRWVKEGMEDLLTRRRVEEAAREWDRSGQDESLLYRGVQLDKAMEWQKRRI